MSDQQNNNSPSFESAAYTRQIDDWAIVNDCFEGTSRIREQGRVYLPQHPAEYDDDYNIRLGTSVFWNAFKRTVQGLVGMVCRKPPTLDEDVSSQIREHWENIDLKGTHGELFVKDCFTAALRDGHAFILVDMPAPLTDNNGNLRQDVTQPETQNRRPYWVKITKDQIINWRTEKTDEGRVVLVQVTIKEVLLEPSGDFGEAEVVQYRVLRPGEWQLYRETTVDKRTEVTLTEQGVTTLDFIPLVALPTSQWKDYFETDPPLLDLAYENLRHYRLQSDLDHVLHVANVPIKFAAGLNKDEDLVIGPHSVVHGPEGSDLKYVEHEGHAIGKAQEEIQTSKANMAALGLAMLAAQPMAKKGTATEAIIDFESESSELASMAGNLKDAIETALMYHAAFLRLDQGGSATVNKDFTKLVLDPAKLRELREMVRDDQLTLETMWQIMLEADELPDNFDPIKEREGVQKNRQDKANAGAVILGALDQSDSMSGQGVM